MIDDVDANKDGILDFTEFLRLMQQQAAIEPSTDDLREAFGNLIMIITVIYHATN